MSKVHCHICDKKLENSESIIAGIGQLCHKKIKFIEEFGSENLIQFTNIRKKPLDSFKSNKTFILKHTMEQLILAQIINYDRADRSFLYLDRIKISKEIASNSGKSLARIYSEAYREDLIENIEYAAEIDMPMIPDLKREFINFGKQHSLKIAQNDQVRKDLIDKGLHESYQRIQAKDDMTQTQILNREQLMLFKEKSPDIYKYLYSHGVYQKATFIARIANFKNIESFKAGNYIKRTMEDSIAIKDYGLTDDEILNGLKQSSNKLDAIIFSAYINGNRNINLMLSLADKFEDFDVKLKINAYKALVKMGKSVHYSKEELEFDLKQ